ncbi:hypothetical protein AA13595_0382 [Gluconacetobacter johannae DSM 13595]|nr:hypothetical protein AA13595_0382 [Gluconacetobacter johannae DSM 13595]
MVERKQAAHPECVAGRGGPWNTSPLNRAGGFNNLRLFELVGNSPPPKGASAGGKGAFKHDFVKRPTGGGNLSDGQVLGQQIR